MPRIKSNLTGEVSNVRGDIARELIKMGVATALESLGPDTEGSPSRLPKYQPAVVPEPQWQVLIRNNSDDTKVLVIRMTLPNMVADYFGPPADVNRKIAWPGGFRWANGFGRAVPDEILSDYNRQYKRNEGIRGVAFGLPQDVNTGPSNETMAANKEACDRELASGNAHYSPK